jgi:formate hydrogenlyase transcriptional activator
MPSSAPTQDPTRARYEILLETTESIASHRQLSALLEELSRSLKRVVPFDFLAVILHDRDRRTVRLHLLATDHPVHESPQGEVPEDDTPTGEVVETQQPCYVPDLENEQRFPAIRRLLLANGVLSFCSVPLTTAQRRLGSLNFGSLRKDAYCPEEIAFMGQVAKQVAVAVDNALTHEAARRYEQQLAHERDRLKLLLEVNNAVVAHLDTKELFQAIAASLRSAFGMEYASLCLYDEEARSLRLQALDFPTGQGLIKEMALVPLEGSPAGLVYTSREARIFSAEEFAALSPLAARYLLGEGLRCFVGVPLISHHGVVGTLNLGAARDNFFCRDDLPLLAQIAGQIVIALENALAYRRIEELNTRLNEEKVYLEDEIRTESRFEEVIGQSRALKAILKQVETVAPTDSTVLIYGETGTGKELIARAIHDLSQRRGATFVKLNCAAIPTGLLESEMFGHEKGAFTGAIAQRIGRFELAHRGTMFLDEVGEIPLELQTKLLRVLQEREFERLGSSRTIKTDARLVAATNRDLEQMVEQRLFRADLYYRLHVFPIMVPPLRERQEDIPLLVRYFTQQFARRMGRTITSIPSEAMETLVRYRWPGNIRELQNFIERAVIITTGSTLAAPVRELKRPAGSPAGPAPAASVVTLEDAERDAIVRALREAGGRVGGDQGAAARLGMKRTTLQAKMRKLGIEAKSM